MKISLKVLSKIQSATTFYSELTIAIHRQLLIGSKLSKSIDIFDISGASYFNLVSEYKSSTSIEKVLLSEDENYIFIAEENGNILIIDIQKSSNPTEISSKNFGYNLKTMKINPWNFNLMFVSFCYQGRSGILILDISNKFDIKYCTELLLENDFCYTDMTFSNDKKLLLISESFSAIEILNIENPFEIKSEGLFDSNFSNLNSITYGPDNKLFFVTSPITDEVITLRIQKNNTIIDKYHLPFSRPILLRPSKNYNFAYVSSCTGLEGRVQALILNKSEETTTELFYNKDDLCLTGMELSGDQNIFYITSRTEMGGNLYAFQVHIQCEHNHDCIGHEYCDSKINQCQMFNQKILKVNNSIEAYLDNCLLTVLIIGLIFFAFIGPNVILNKIKKMKILVYKEMFTESPNNEDDDDLNSVDSQKIESP